RLASTGGERLRGELKLWDTTDGKPLAGREWRNNLLAAVAFHPDGRRLATGGHDGDVVTWDAATLGPVGPFQGRTERDVPWASVAYSADGARVAAGSPAGLLRVWDAATGQELFSAHPPTEAGVLGLAFGGPTGRILAAAVADNTVQGWFARSGKPAFTLRGHRRAVTAVALRPPRPRPPLRGPGGAAPRWALPPRAHDRPPATHPPER